MIVKKNENLSRHVTVHIGGTAEAFYIPENTDELIELIKNEPVYRVISGGSNLLINDEKVFPCVISMEKCCADIVRKDVGRVYVGASVRIQKVIRQLHEWELGGFEFLFSLPAFFGGIVFMNAGRGSDKKCIGDFIESVEYIDENGKTSIISKNECLFGYRKSVFQDKKWVITGATLNCSHISKAEGEEEIKKRIEHCKQFQDMRYPNFGSLFCKSSFRIMNHLRKKSSCDNGKKSACLSNKSINWVVNRGEGTYADVMKIISHVKLVHKLLFKKCELEVRIWDQ